MFDLILSVDNFKKSYFKIPYNCQCEEYSLWEDPMRTVLYIIGKKKEKYISSDIIGMNVCAMLSCFSFVWLFVTPWTIAHQAPLFMEFSRQVTWSGLPFPSPGHLPDQGIEPILHALSGIFFTNEPEGSPV